MVNIAIDQSFIFLQFPNDFAILRKLSHRKISVSAKKVLKRDAFLTVVLLWCHILIHMTLGLVLRPMANFRYMQICNHRRHRSLI